MKNNLLMTPSQVIAQAFSNNERVSVDSIRESKILVAQDYYLRPALGDALYDRLVGGEQRGFTREFLCPALAHYVRYGVISELSIQVGDDGLTVFRNEVISKEGSSLQEAAAQQDSSLGRTVSDTSQTDQVGKGTAKETATSQLNRRDTDASTAAAIDHIITQSEEATKDRTDDTTLKETASKNTSLQDRVNDQKQSQTQGQTKSRESKDTFAPSTDVQREIVMQRALFDANVLMGMAVRYIRANGELFKDYNPSVRSIGGRLVF